jgi:hypothetical protein
VPPTRRDPCPEWPPAGASAPDALAALPADAPRLALPDGGWVAIRTCRWREESDEVAAQDLVRIGADGAPRSRLGIGFRRVGGDGWIEKPALALAGAEPLEVLVTGSYEEASDSDSVTAREVRRHILLDARTNHSSADPTCGTAIGEPELRRSDRFDEMEGAEVTNLGSTGGDEAWGLEARAKRVDPLCWRIDEHWRSPAGVAARVWGYTTCWNVAAGSLETRCDAGPYPTPRTAEGA